MFDSNTKTLETALSEPNSIILSEDLTNKLFGSINPLGKITRSDRGMDLEVTGVFKGLSANSHLQFELLVSHETMEV